MLERYGNLPTDSGGDEVYLLSKSLSPIFGIPVEEVKRHLKPLINDGHIFLAPEPKGGFRWIWARS